MDTTTRVAGALVASAVLLLAGCAGSGQTPGAGVSPTVPSTETVPVATPSHPSSPGAPSTSAAQGRPVTIAFAGDVHFASFLAGRLAHPTTAVGPMARVLAGADLSIVNLETAVTTRGTPQPKQYTFRAPPVAFTALKDAGIDVVTMANNHALDYGPVSIPDALAAAAATHLPLIGIGADATDAYKPWIVTVGGQRIAFLAATAVLDSNLISSWSAEPSHPGLATALNGDNARLVAAVKAVRDSADVVIVDLHYGSDLETCPTDIQRKIVSDLTAAGADIIVGQHAHVLLGGGYNGHTYVDYGLGNFEFYVPNGGVQGETGVLELTVEDGTVTSPRWIPGRIQDGVPTALHGPAATEALHRWTDLRSCANLSAMPSRAPR